MEFPINDKSASDVKKKTWKTISPSRVNENNNESIIGKLKESSSNLINIFKQQSNGSNSVID